MIVLKITGAILHTVLKAIVAVIQVILTLLGICLSFGIGVFMVVGGIIGSIFVFSSVLCLIMGIASVKEFWGMMLVGVLFGGIPQLIQLIGVESIYTLKKALSRI